LLIFPLLHLFYSTHYAGYQGAIAARNLLLPFTDPGVLPNVPSTIYTSPEVATIGISEKNAIQLYGNSKVVVYQRHLSHVDRAVCDNTQEGLIKIICSKKNLQILGATVVAPVAGEMISEIAVMMKARLSFDKVMYIQFRAFVLLLQMQQSCRIFVGFLIFQFSNKIMYNLSYCNTTIACNSDASLPGKRIFVPPSITFFQ
jgi:hypothetical protein